MAFITRRERALGLTFVALSALSGLIAGRALAQATAPVSATMVGTDWTVILLALIAMIQVIAVPVVAWVLSRLSDTATKAKAAAETAASTTVATNKAVEKVGETVNGHTTVLDNRIKELTERVLALSESKAMHEERDAGRASVPAAPAVPGDAAAGATSPLIAQAGKSLGQAGASLKKTAQNLKKKKA